MKTTPARRYLLGTVLIFVGLGFLVYSRDFPTSGMFTHTAFYLDICIIGIGLAYAVLLLMSRRGMRLASLFVATAIPALLLGGAGADALKDISLSNGNTASLFGFAICCVLSAMLLWDIAKPLRGYMPQGPINRRMLLWSSPANMIPSGITMMVIAAIVYFTDPAEPPAGMFTHTAVYLNIALFSAGAIELWLGIALRKRLTVIPVLLAACVPPFFLGGAANDALKDLQLGQPSTGALVGLALICISAWQMADLWQLLRPRTDMQHTSTSREACPPRQGSQALTAP